LARRCSLPPCPALRCRLRPACRQRSHRWTAFRRDQQPGCVGCPCGLVRDGAADHQGGNYPFPLPSFAPGRHQVEIVWTPLSAMSARPSAKGSHRRRKPMLE
jgi:hypothetical protein